MKKYKLPFKVKSAILACGADLKGAFALAKGSEAYLFDGFGDLADLDNFTRYEKAIRQAVKKLHIKPAVVACDMHPGYFSTRFAKDYTMYDVRCTMYEIQHHEAHIASAILDNAIKGAVLGVAFDGTGYGTDGNIWGGEFFSGNVKKMDRVYHLDYVPMPGGEKVIAEPWRMAASFLYYVFGNGFLKQKIDFVKHTDKKKWRVLKEMIERKINSPLTSSMGRLFDSVSSLVLNKRIALFEAELPIELERCADPDIYGHYNYDNSATMIKDIVSDLKRNIQMPVISAKFHNTIAYLILRIAKKVQAKSVVLSGGVFQNKLLTGRTIELLDKNGFTVYTHSNVETSDSGIPVGQITIVNERLLCV